MTNQKTAKPGRRMARTPGVLCGVTPHSKMFQTIAVAAPTPRPESKIALVIGLLKRAEGASLDELAAATSWLHHSTRAALTGLKKKGWVINKIKCDNVTRYFIAGPAA